MFKHKFIVLTVLLAFSISLVNCKSTANKEVTKIKTLIIDGQNNHKQWPKITFMIKKYLEDSNLFSVDVARTAYTWEGEKYIEKYPIDGLVSSEALEEPKSDPNFSPDFSKYDVVICNFGWKAAAWPEKTQKAFEAYIKEGGGFVAFHAADNSFPEWLAYNQMVGLGGWGGRTEKDGPYVYYNDNDELVRDTSPGGSGSHGQQHEFQIQIRNSKHPITKGMPLEWLHTKDELYAKLRGPAENMEVLATAYSSEDYKGTKRHEPMMMTLTYGEGRIFHTPLGHEDTAIECVGFMTSMLRGAEWAATGRVTTPIPEDFPTADKTSKRKFFN